MNKFSSAAINIVAPRYLHRSILKSVDPSLHFKLLTKEEVLKLFLGEYAAEYILEIAFKEKITYDQAAEYLRLAPYLKPTVSSERARLLRKFQTDYALVADDIGRQIFRAKETVLYGYGDDDRDLTEVLAAFGISWTKAEPSPACSLNRIQVYPDVQTEIGEMLEQIAELLDRKTPLSAITIVVPPSYYSTLRLLAPLFKIPLRPIAVPLFEYSPARCFYQALRSGRSIHEFQADPLLGRFVITAAGLLEKGYPLSLISAYLKRLLQTTTLETPTAGIQVATSLTGLTASTYLFVAGLNDELCKPHKDDGFLNDAEKLKDTYLLTSYETDALRRRDFIRAASVGTAVLSFAENGATVTYRQADFSDSALLYAEDFSPALTSRYSVTYDRLLLAQMKDDETKYGLKNSYNSYLTKQIGTAYDTYNPRFKSERLIRLNKPFQLSATSVAVYSRCPFAFFLKNILKVAEEGERFNLALGAIAHKALELEAAPDDERLISYIETFALGPRDEFYLGKLLKANLIMRDYFADFMRSLPDFGCRHEEELTVGFESGAIVGKSDMILSDGPTFMVLDFKSAVKDFDPILNYFGFDVQLLTYIDLYQRTYPEAEPLGAFFVPLFPKSAGRTSRSDFKFRGYFVEAALLQDRLGQEKFKETFTYTAGKNHSFDDLKADLKDLEDVWNRTFKGLTAGDFRLTPKRIKAYRKLDSCRFCDYRDLCFYRKKDLIFLEIPERFKATAAAETETETNDYEPVY